MNPRILTLIIYLFFSVSSQAQQKKEAASFMRLTGTIGTEFELTMNLVRIGDSLFGTVSYHIVAPINDVRYINMDGSVRQVYGKSDSKGNVRIREWGNDRGPVFSGILSHDNQISGTWLNAGLQSTKKKFRLSENYSAGSHKFAVIADIERLPLTKEKTEPSARLQLILVLPDRKSNTPFPKSVTDTILQMFNENPVNGKDQHAVIKAIKDVFFTDYVQSNEPFLNEMSGPSMYWELLRSGNVIYNDRDRLSYMVMTYEFTGGAHGLETCRYKTFDLKSGKVIGIREVFHPGFENKLTEVLTAKLRQSSGLKDPVKLTDRGYFTDQIRPSENFYFNAQGIGFVYNPYEIAPHSFGTITIFVPFDEISSVIKQR